MAASRKSNVVLFAVVAAFLTVWYAIPYLILSFIFMDLLWPAVYLDSITARVVATVPFLVWTMFAGCICGDVVKDV